MEGEGNGEGGGERREEGEEGRRGRGGRMYFTNTKLIRRCKQYVLM